MILYLLLVAVRCMLYGFGDDEQPYAETVDLLEDLVIEYISETVSEQYPDNKNFLHWLVCRQHGTLNL